MRSGQPSRRVGSCSATSGWSGSNGRARSRRRGPGGLAGGTEPPMPQIEEAQFVNWGSMRPDIIPLAAPGITIAVGPNGSGKTCWLDVLKVILGVADFSKRRTPASYIFNGGPSNIPADQAWLRATFANPVQSGQRHRVFAVAGNGCENAEHVTIICRVQGDKRKYLVLPGHVTWGREHPIDADLDAL